MNSSTTTAPALPFRAFIVDQAGNHTYVYKKTLLAAKRAYAKLMRENDGWKECGWESFTKSSGYYGKWAWTA